MDNRFVYFWWKNWAFSGWIIVQTRSTIMQLSLFAKPWARSYDLTWESVGEWEIEHEDVMRSLPCFVCHRQNKPHDQVQNHCKNSIRCIFGALMRTRRDPKEPNCVAEHWISGMCMVWWMVRFDKRRLLNSPHNTLAWIHRIRFGSALHIIIVLTNRR